MTVHTMVEAGSTAGLAVESPHSRRFERHRDAFERAGRPEAERPTGRATRDPRDALIVARLVEEAASGDQRAWDALVDRFRRRFGPSPAGTD